MVIHHPLSPAAEAEVSMSRCRFCSRMGRIQVSGDWIFSRVKQKGGDAMQATRAQEIGRRVEAVAC